MQLFQLLNFIPGKVDFIGSGLAHPYPNML